MENSNSSPYENRLEHSLHLCSKACVQAGTWESGDAGAGAAQAPRFQEGWDGGLCFSREQLGASWFRPLFTSRLPVRKQEGFSDGVGAALQLCGDTHPRPLGASSPVNSGGCISLPRDNHVSFINTSKHLSNNS